MDTKNLEYRFSIGKIDEKYVVYREDGFPMFLVLGFDTCEAAAAYGDRLIEGHHALDQMTALDQELGLQ